MNLFSDLTVIDTILVCVEGRSNDGQPCISINGQLCSQSWVPLKSDINIVLVDAWIEKLVIDQIDVTDYIAVQTQRDHAVLIPGPFYHWYHEVSGQGWLLSPTLPG
jgi:hypothetical protein